MLFKNILVPYDGSTYSNRAFKIALELAQKYNSKVTIVSCINIFSAGWFGKSAFEQTILKKLRGKIMKEIQELEKTAKKYNVPTKGRILEATSITKTILSLAKTKNIDLIIIGAHGRGFFDRAILGSVVNNIVQQSHCPVLVVK